MRNSNASRRTLKARILDLLFPPRCILCQKLLQTPAPVRICPACQTRYAPGTRVLHPSGGTFFSGCIAALPYAGDVRSAVHRFKFGGKAAYADTFGPWLAACIRAGFPGASFVITWAPVSRRRLRRRGYDQSRLLAEAAARALGMPCIRLLDKTADTPPQSGLKDPARRRANVAGVYAAAAGAPIAGARILVIDDVFTTGATLSECARTLLMAGAERVDCAVLTAKI